MASWLPSVFVGSSSPHIAFGILASTIGVLTLPSQTKKMYQADRDTLCITEGSLQETSDRRLSVNVPKMRAYFNRASLQSIAADFTYLGPTQDQTVLGSGETRRQFGVKLNAQDACNTVYAMWRFEPQSEIDVSVKSNPGQHASTECGNRGYRRMKPLHHSPVPLLHPGDKHQLRAELDNRELRISVDNKIVWDGRIGQETLDFEGPVGIRSDNVMLEFGLQVGRSSGPNPSYVLGCQTASEP